MRYSRRRQPADDLPIEDSDEIAFWELEMAGREVGSNFLREEKSDEPARVYDLEERTARFGEAVIRFAKRVTREPVTVPLISQLVRSGTSVGANYCEADDAVSKKEFLHKIGTCKKEARETKHWLRMMAVADEKSKPDGRKLWREARELPMIFAAIIRNGKRPD